MMAVHLPAEPAMAWLSLLLFLPWFAILGGLFCWYPRQPRHARRWWFDGLALLLALACSVLAMHWGYRHALGQSGTGPIWPQVLAVLCAYTAFLVVMLLALGVRPYLLGGMPTRR